MRFHAITAALFAAAALIGCADNGAAADETQADTATADTATADAAPDIAPMKAAIEQMYAHPDTVDNNNPPLPMTEEFGGLFAAYNASMGTDHEQDNLGSSWLVNGQDYELGPVTVTEEPIDETMTMLLASFTNFGTPTKVRYVFKQQDGAWKLDDIIDEGDDDNATSIADTLRGW